MNFEWCSPSSVKKTSQPWDKLLIKHETWKVLRFFSVLSVSGSAHNWNNSKIIRYCNTKFGLVILNINCNTYLLFWFLFIDPRATWVRRSFGEYKFLARDNNAHLNAFSKNIDFNMWAVFIFSFKSRHTFISFDSKTIKTSGLP